MSGFDPRTIEHIRELARDIVCSHSATADWLRLEDIEGVLNRMLAIPSDPYEPTADELEAALQAAWVHDRQIPGGKGTRVILERDMRAALVAANKVRQRHEPGTDCEDVRHEDQVPDREGRGPSDRILPGGVQRPEAFVSVPDLRLASFEQEGGRTMTQKNDAIKAAMDELHMYLPDKPTEMLAYITEDVISRYEAALAVAPDPAPDDAEFEAALDVLITQSEFLGSVRDTSTRDDVEHVRSARQRILALRAQATHAGLRCGTHVVCPVCRGEGYTEEITTEYKGRTVYVGVRSCTHCDAKRFIPVADVMLKDATDAR